MRNYSRLTLLIFYSFFVCGIAANAQTTTELYSKKMADSQMKRSGNISTWDYPNGLFIESILKVYDKYKDEKYYTYALEHAKATVKTNGEIGSKYNFGAYNLDYVNPGMFLLKIYEKEKDNRYKIALETLRKQLSEQPRNSEGGFWHKQVYPNQMWLDGLFMGSRFYAVYDVTFNEGKQLDDVAKQFTLVHSKTYNEETQLNYHAWAEDVNDANAFWAKKEEPFKGCSHEYWSRGIGWYFAALTEVLEVLPKNHPEREKLLSILNDIAAGVKRYQDESSGLWYQLTEYDDNTCVDGKCNWLEASASCMFTYALLKSVRLGFLSKEEYLPTGIKAYEGIITHLITTNKATGDISLIDICSSAGLGPANDRKRDGSIKYYLTGSDAGRRVSNDLKGVGPFIMASVEYETIDDPTSIKDIKNETSFPAKADIYDITGKKIAGYKSALDSDLSLLLSSYPKGVYIVKINGSETKKIVN